MNDSGSFVIQRDDGYFLAHPSRRTKSSYTSRLQHAHVFGSHGEAHAQGVCKNERVVTLEQACKEATHGP